MSRAEDRANATADTTLDQFYEDDEDERPNWTPGNSDAPDTGSRVQCETCENTVSKQFARVFGDNDDRVEICGECATYRDLKTGAVNRGGFS